MYVIIIIGDSMKKVVIGVLIGLFIIIAMFITISLLAYNEYGVTEFGNSSLVFADKNMEKYGYKSGDLIVATKENNDSIVKGNSILYYNNYEPKVAIEKGKVLEISSDSSQFYLDNNNSIAKKYVIGTSDSEKVYPVIGGILKFLETKVGYLLVIILPILVLFAYLIRRVTVELKEKKN